MSNFLDKAGLQHYTEKVKVYVRTIANSGVQRHELRTDNPHLVTKKQVGLGNVTNEAQIPLSQKGVASGVATLGTDGKLTAAQLPAMKTVNGVSVVGSGNISIDLSLYKVVDTLPTTGIDATKIYIVPAKTTEDKNIKAEYIYTGNPASTYDATKWEKLGEAQTNIVVDAELSATSTNPIQNKAVKSAVDTLTQSITDVENKNIAQDLALTKKLDKTDYVVDAELSATSENPIQNKAVKKAIDTLTSSVNSKVATSTYNTKMSALDSSISALQSKNTAQDSAIEKKLDKSAYVVDKQVTPQSDNPVSSTGVATFVDGTRRELITVFNEDLDKKLDKADMVAITNEEIDAMF